MKHLLVAVALLAAFPSATALAQYSRGAPSYDEDDDDRPAPDRRDYAPRGYDRRDDRGDYDRPGYGDTRRPDLDRRDYDDRGGSERGRGADMGGGGPVPLYVGTAPNCNAAIVSSDPNYKGCPTRPIGSTMPSGAGARLYAGAGGAVTNAPGGRTLGQLSANGRQELYVGLQRGCNQGVVTTNPRHANCPTQAIGWTR